MVAAIKRRFDDDDLSDADGNGPYDKRFPGQRVIADGGRVRVPIVLTDGMPPEWMRPPRCALFDARHHRPHYAVVDRADPHVKAAERAYADHNAYLRDAWKTMGGGTGGQAHTTAPPADQPDEDDDDLSPRDRYILEISNAYKMGAPYGGNGAGGDPTQVEAQRRRWLSPGATPGSDAVTATKDAAVADRDQAYGEYLDRISNGWRR
jgi:hypothetical protein